MEIAKREDLMTDTRAKQFSVVRTFVQNLKSRIKGEKHPFKKLHKASAETYHCREYDIQGIPITK